MFRCGKPTANSRRFQSWGALLLVALAALLLAQSKAARRLRRRSSEQLRRHRLHFYGRLQGLAYRIGGGHPDVDVADQVLADRIRSVLGPLEQTLDVPRIHVMVNHHVAMLHGEVMTDDDRTAIISATRRIPGVRDVDSHLTVGLTPGDNRPSDGRLNRQPSHVLTVLSAAAEQAAGRQARADAIVGAVLTSWMERLPRRERDHLLGHLPADVRVLLNLRRRSPASGLRSPSELYITIAARSDLHDYYTAREATKAVLAALWDLVPEERDDVRAVMPEPLADLWGESLGH